MSIVIEVLPSHKLPSTEDWNAALADQQLDVVIQRWLPWTSEDGRFKMVASVGGALTAVDVVDAAVESRREWFPVCHIMVPGARRVVKFEWWEGDWRAEAGAWGLAATAGTVLSGRLFTDDKKLGLLPSAAGTMARELFASLPAPSGDPEAFEVGAEGEDGALLEGVFREMDKGIQ